MLQNYDGNTIKSCHMFSDHIMEIGIICIALVVVWVAAFIIIMKVRKAFRIGVKGSDSSEGMTIEGLEKIHGAGMISDEEFSRMRRAMLGLPAENAEKGKKNPPSAGGFGIMENPGKSDNNESDNGQH